MKPIVSLAALVLLIAELTNFKFSYLVSFAALIGFLRIGEWLRYLYVQNKEELDSAIEFLRNSYNSALNMLKKTVPAKKKKVETETVTLEKTEEPAGSESENKDSLSSLTEVK